MAYEFYLGIDLREQSGGTIALVEKRADGLEAEPVYRIDRLEHVEAGRTQDDIAEHVEDVIAASPYAGRTIVVVNKTDTIGQAVLEALADEGQTPLGVSITTGDTATQLSSSMGAGGDEVEDKAGFFVSRRALLGALHDLYGSGQLNLGQDTPESMSVGEALDEEEVEAGQSPFLISTALACWLGEQHTFDPADRLGGFPRRIEQKKPGVRKRVP